MMACGRICILALTALVAGCAEARLSQTGSLTNYSGLQPADGRLTKSKIFIRAPALLAARTARIVPTTISASISEKLPSAEERALLANAVDRSLCANLSDRYEITTSKAPADLTIHAHIADVVATDPVAAGASKVATVGVSYVLPGVPTPRIPSARSTRDSNGRDVVGARRKFIYERSPGLQLRGCLRIGRRVWRGFWSHAGYGQEPVRGCPAEHAHGTTHQRKSRRRPATSSL
jgi:hypothetical protein